MFITLQYPLFDHRNLDTKINRVARPNWYNPDSKDWIRYTGDILTKKKKYNGPWDSDAYYCNAKGVISLCGTGELNYFKLLKSSNVQSQVMFRRLQADGNFLAKYELGFTDKFEEGIQEQPDIKAAKKAFINHIRNYLNCPARIKVGNRLKNYIALADADEHLKHAYYWATLTGVKSFNDKDLKFRIESLDPFMIIHINTTKFPLSGLGFKKVKFEENNKLNIELFYCTISYRPNNQSLSKNIDTWLIGVENDSISTPTSKEDFHYFPIVIKELRKNLLKIPTLVKVYKKLNSQIQSIPQNESIKVEDVQLRMVKFFHKSSEILMNEKGHSQNQQEIIGLAMDPEYSSDSSINELKVEIGNAVQWINTLPETKDIVKMKNELETRFNDYFGKTTDLTEKSDPKKPIIYFSYAWGDEKETGVSREKLINELYNSLSGEDIELRRDKMDIQYGGLISEFMTAIGEGDLIVIGLSEKYFKSKYCMWELCEVWRNSKNNKKLFIPKILPLLIEKLDLGSIDLLSRYMDYWTEQFNQFNEFMAKYPQQFGPSQQAEQLRIREIKDNFAEIVGLLNDMNALTNELIKEDDFKVIKDAINERMGRTG